MKQMALPGFEIDYRRKCPVCQQHKTSFVRWHPARKWSDMCVDCYRLAPDIRILQAGNKRDREAVIYLENELRDMTKKRQYVPSGVSLDRLKNTSIQLTFPFCERCGHPHTRFNLSTYAVHCQRCADELTVESFWSRRNSPIFANDDDEGVMDRIYRSHPELFERRVLPNYWFTLKLAEQGEGSGSVE